MGAPDDLALPRQVEGARVRVMLASSSPRRRTVLQMLGLDPLLAEPAAVERPYAAPEEPHDYAVGQALAKLRAAAILPQAVGIAADTVVVLGGRILGKPESRAHAREMLRSLSDAAHDVITGIAVAWRGRERSGFERTRVTFRRLAESEITRYVEEGEPLDKAGAYGIQGRGAALVRSVEGCFFNVVGLPVNRLLELLSELGLRYDFISGLVDSSDRRSARCEAASRSREDPAAFDRPSSSS